MVKQVKQKHWWTLKILEKWETANPKWRPKKGISLVNEKLKKKWYDPASKQDIETTYMSLLQLPQKELVRMGGDLKQPMLVRILVKSMLSKKSFDIIEKMLDRWIGKATQPIDAKVVNEVVDPLTARLKELWM